jgi:CRISPR-associated protein Cmr5
MAHYQLAQAEALVLMSWVKKFAKAFLAEDYS